MRRTIQIYMITCWMLYMLQPATAQQIPVFKEGERVVFLGNSITDRGHYHSYIWLYYMTRFPNLRLEVFNAGIGGDRVSHMDKRFETDVLPKRPTYLVVTFGMNDSGYEYNKPNSVAFAENEVKKSEAAYLLLEEKLKKLSGTKIILAGSTPYEENAKLASVPLKNKNKTIQEIICFQQEAGKRNNWGFIDFNAPILSINNKYQQQDSTFTLCGIDRIHPDNDGNMVMAYLFLKDQGFRNLPVAIVEIDASGKKLVQSENCKISGLKSGKETISFDYLSNALPYPLDTVPRARKAVKSQASAMQVIPFMEEMNQEIFRVKGLKGRYELIIDKQHIGIWDASAFEKGINLAELSNTPQYQQALCIMHLNEERWEIERQLRQYALIQYAYFQKKGLLFADNREALDAMQKDIATNYLLQELKENYTKSMFPEIRESWQQEMDLLTDRIYRINKPVKREVVIRRIDDSN